MGVFNLDDNMVVARAAGVIAVLCEEGGCHDGMSCRRVMVALWCVESTQVCCRAESLAEEVRKAGGAKALSRAIELSGALEDPRLQAHVKASCTAGLTALDDWAAKDE